MSDRITPALTPEEWKLALDNEFEMQALLIESCDEVRGNDHKRAALSLYGQPFGFTREDAGLLRLVVGYLGTSGEPHHHHRTWISRVNDLADRIEALLPPTRTPE